MSTNIQPAAAPVVKTSTLGSLLDSKITSLHERIAVLEYKAKADVSQAEAWIGKNWPHFVTWASVAYSVFKHL